MVDFMIMLAVLIGLFALIYWAMGKFSVPAVYCNIWLVVSVVLLALFILKAFGLLDGAMNVQLQ